MKPKKLPLRMCLGCQEMKPKKELIRIVKNKENEVSCDKTGKKAGRGAYICKSIVCLEKVQKARRLEKAFEMKIEESIFCALQKELGEDNDK